MIKYQIVKNDVIVETLSAKGMESIYRKYKKYCWQRHASVMVKCSQEESVGFLYWTDLQNNYYLKQN